MARENMETNMGETEVRVEMAPASQSTLKTSM
jgi:hypothetical protein